MRLLITGGSSYLGRHLVPLAHQLLPTAVIAYTYWSADPLQLDCAYRLDLRDATAVQTLLAEFQPTAIIHTAGSNRIADMTRVIEDGTRFLVQNSKSARFIHLSTDSLLDGRHPPYSETALPNPLNAYGEAKAHAETVVATHPNHVIIRTSLIYGLQEMDQGTQWMASSLQNGQSVTLFTNQYRNPIWVQSLCLACLELLPHAYSGILNVAGQQCLSRADFALKMLDWWHIDGRSNLIFAPDTSGKWALNCELDMALAQSLLQTPLLGVDQVLQQNSRL